MASGSYVDGWGRNSERVPGARRQKVMGYIRAANELRQTYQSQLQSQVRGSEDDGMPGSFSAADIVRSGDEEMLLFPSYAHRHIKRQRHTAAADSDMPGSLDNLERPADSGDAEYWRKEWERYEDANAVVDVDVRGWIYSPQRGPMSRRNRLLVAVARKLSGIPAPEPSPQGSRDSSVTPSSRARTHESMMSHEEEAAAREADIIAQRGQREADAAWQGTYSTENSKKSNDSSRRPDSPSRASIRTDVSDDSSSQYSLASRLTPYQSTDMTREELTKANELLMTRLRPFMTLPLINTPITVFFFNDEKAISKSVYTNEAGHFNLRAALNFVPNKVRVLASENLSAVEDVIVTDIKGISLISDIDDTIKHSAIASGAREIFKNTFIRDLSELTIEGVKEWYNRMAQMGVQMHYVSNSPWQLYPLLKSFFSLAGLPSGSIHLKQYSGMLQGIFEPAAERKKTSLEKIFHDFPERKFILVGDSGEADLEVYTDVVLANPGRVLGVFIRDVTTPERKHFFDQTLSQPTSVGNVSTSSDRSDAPSVRPDLPLRPRTMQPPRPLPDVEADLIDFSDDADDEGPAKRSLASETDVPRRPDNGSSRPPPNKPMKPSNLRSHSTMTQSSGSDDRNDSSSRSDGRGPPPPPKPRRAASAMNNTASPQETPRPPLPLQRQSQGSSQRPGMESRTSSSYSGRGEDDGYVASARRHLASAYNALPALRAPSPSREDFDHRTSAPAPPRRGISSYPAAAARWATGATGGDPAAGGDGGAPGAPYNKKEEFWKRRWARAQEIMRSRNVVLRTWRVGGDVMDQCIDLVERESKESRKQ